MASPRNHTELYLRIAKTFAIDLADEKDRVKAIKWIKFLQASEDAAEKRTKLHAIQLLLICLQRKRLVGPFIDPPDMKKSLTQYSWAYQPADVARLILENEFEKIGKPPITLEFSGDLCEYVATQTIPQFGAHFFYASSPEEVKTWDNLDKAIIPKGYLSLTVAESPETSMLAKAVLQASNERKTSRKRKLDRQRKSNQFTDVTVIEENGALKDSFTPEVLASKSIHTQLLQDAIEDGIIRRSEILSDVNFMIDKGPKITSPHMETVNITTGRKRIEKRRNLKNITSKKQKFHTEKTFQEIAEEDEDKDEDEKGDREKELAAQKDAMLAKMPARLRERLAKRFVPKDLQQFLGRDRKVARTPEIFRKGAKRPFRKYRLGEFGLDKDEPFYPAEDVFQDLEYQPPKQGRKGPRRREPNRLQIIKEVDAVSIASSVSFQKSPEQEDVEASWNRSYKRMMDRRAARPRSEQRASLTPRRKDALDRLNQLKAAQPRRLVFDDMDVDIEPEEVQFEKFLYTEFPDEDKDPSILVDDQMNIDDVFGDEQIGNVSLLPIPKSIKELEKAEVLLDDEMEIDDIFGDDEVADPNIVFKETPRRGGLRLGRRVLNLSSVEPMHQVFVEQYDDVVFDESLKELEPERYTPPMNEAILNQYLDVKLKRLKPGRSEALPYNYGPWAESFRRDVERIERGEESDDFPEDAAKFVYKRPTDDRSFLSDSEMETSDIFGNDRVGEPSPVLLAKARKHTRAFEALRKRFEAEKSRRCQQAIAQQSTVDQDLLDPYIYESFSDDRPGLLDASIEDEVLEQALVQRVPTPRKRDPLQSFERKMDSSLKYYTDGSSIADDRQPRLVYDDEFLNRRIVDIPANESLMEDDEMDFDDIFGAEEVEEPVPMREIPQPIRSTPRRPPLVRHSHLYHPERPYQPKMEDILPFGYIDEESFPTDKFLESSFILSGVEDYVEEIETPELASGAGEAPEGEDETEGTFDTAQEIFQHTQMETDDVFGDDQIMSPSQMRKITPTRAALSKSIRQSFDVHNFFNKYRRKKGLPLADNLQVPLEGIKKFIEAQESLMDPIVNRSLREPFPGLLDEPILEEDLGAPLVERPKKPDPFAEYEAKVLDEILDDRVAAFMSADLSIIEDGEMAGDMFDEGMIADPLPMRDIPMPKRAVSTPKQVQYSHLYFMDKRPSPARPQRIPQEPLPEELLEEFSEPEMVSEVTDMTEHFEIDAEDEEILKHIFDGELPSDIKGKIKYPSYSSDPAHYVGSRELSDVLRRAAKLRDRRGRDSTFDDISILGTAELQTDDVFGDENVLPLSHFPKSPTKMILEQSFRVTKNVQNLRNRLRALRNLSPIEQIVSAPYLQQLNEAEERLFDPIAFKNIKEGGFGLLDEPVLEDQAARPLIASPQQKDPFDSYERRMDESMRRRREAEREPSFLSESEMLDMFAGDAVAEPVPLREIPMPSPKDPKPAQTVKYSHLYHMTRPYKPPLPLLETIPDGHISTESFPGDVSAEYLSFIPSGFEERQDQQQTPPRLEEQAVQAHVQDHSGPSFYESVELVTDDIFGPHMVTPPRWERTRPTDLLIEKTMQQSKEIQNLRNRFRKQLGLPPLEDQLPVEHLRELAAQEAEFERLAQRVGSPFQPRPLDRDPFASFEKQMDASLKYFTDPSDATRPSHFYDSDFLNRRIYEEMPGEDSFISEREMEDVFGADDIAEPPHMRSIPMPPAAPRPPTPRPLRHAHLYHPFGRYKPRIQDILPVEAIDEESFPTGVDDSVLEYEPDPYLADISPPEMISDRDLPPEEQIIDDDDAGILGDEDMPTEDMFGADRIITPKRIKVSPTHMVLARSLQGSADFMNLRNKFRRLRNLLPLDERLPRQHLRRLVEQAESLLDPVQERSVRAEQFEIMDEPILEEQGRRALIASPKKPDPFASFEREMDNTMYYSLSQSAISVLDDEDMDDMFGDDMVAAPVHIKAIPMPSPKPSPVQTPTSPKTPLPRRVAVTHSHLYFVKPPYRPPSPQKTPPRGPQLYPPEDLDEESFPSIDPFSYHTPAQYETQFGSMPISQERTRTRSDLGEEEPPSFLNYTDERSYPFDLLSPIEFRTFKERSYILDRSLGSDVPQRTPLVDSPGPRDFLQYDDSIGPPQIDSGSPGLIQFKEAAPGYYEPVRSTDKRRFARQQKRYVAEQFGLSPSAIPDERLDLMSPPRYSGTPATPRRSTPQRNIPRRIFSPGAGTPSRVSPISRSRGTPSRGFAPPPRYDGTPRRSQDRRDRRQLFSRGPSPVKRTLEARFKEIAAGDMNLSIHIDPRARILKLIAQQPKIEVTAAQKRTAFSPTRFYAKAHPQMDDMLDYEQFPDDDLPVEELFDVPLGPLAYAQYIPTEQEEREIELAQQRRAQFSPQIVVPIPPKRPPPLPDTSPIGRTEVMPHEEGFKWLDNFMPYEQQVGGRRAKTLPKPPPKPIEKRRPRSRPAPQTPAPLDPKPRSKPSKRSVAPTPSRKQLPELLSGSALARQRKEPKPGPSKPRGATSEFQIIKTKTPSKQTLLKKTTVTRITAPPRPKLKGAVQPPCEEKELRLPPIVDKKTITKRMVVGEIGSKKAIKKQSSMQIQKDKNREGVVLVKENVIQTLSQAG